MINCNLIVLGTKAILETADAFSYGLKVFAVDSNFKDEVMGYLRDNKDVNLLNRDTFNFLTLT